MDSAVGYSFALRRVKAYVRDVVNYLTTHFMKINIPCL